MNEQAHSLLLWQKFENPLVTLKIIHPTNTKSATPILILTLPGLSITI
jgi:hypothetical protein